MASSSEKIEEEKNYFDKRIGFLKEEQTILTSIFKTMKDLGEHFQRLQELFMSDEAMSIIDDTQLSEMITRTGFLSGEILSCQEKQKYYLDEVTTLYNDVKKASKEVGKTLNSEDTEKLEIKSASIFKAKKNIQLSPQLVLSFLDTYKHFCIDGHDFYERKKEGEWRKVSVKDIVLYRNQPLHEILKNENRPLNCIPIALEQIIKEIKERGIVQGIFRECGKVSEIEEIINRMSVTNFKLLEPKELSSLLKRFVRDIPGGLIDIEIQNSLLEIWGMKDIQKSARVKQVFLLLKSLPEENYTLLHKIMELNFDIQLEQKTTLMNATNLSICWTPVLFDMTTFLVKMKEANEIVEIMILGGRQMF
ncbi:hypothetical protein ENUP19_0057G0092 [Entamoeba nuttalli]|uniref:RhoGAP domain containing protein n=2 Tax=Entamoeba nuttalli TaxID=412467 RepID=K2HZS7_ENTNP|nr:RhoGAP domain containing protein [Entamoeba nuttalli P19]EKE41965.1 RhoGAP domain containing protein [Entamoeba nuttalli P19]|eukprot:XP_008855698.1 RhoGAP domain containing protein [Entamoeba nuttalli P19]